MSHCDENAPPTAPDMSMNDVPLSDMLLEDFPLENLRFDGKLEDMQFVKEKAFGGNFESAPGNTNALADHALCVNATAVSAVSTEPTTALATNVQVLSSALQPICTHMQNIFFENCSMMYERMTSLGQKFDLYRSSMDSMKHMVEENRSSVKALVEQAHNNEKEKSPVTLETVKQMLEQQASENESRMRQLEDRIGHATKAAGSSLGEHTQTALPILSSVRELPPLPCTGNRAVDMLMDAQPDFAKECALFEALPHMCVLLMHLLTRFGMNSMTGELVGFPIFWNDSRRTSLSVDDTTGDDGERLLLAVNLPFLFEVLCKRARLYMTECPSVTKLGETLRILAFGREVSGATYAAVHARFFGAGEVVSMKKMRNRFLFLDMRRVVAFVHWRDAPTTPRFAYDVACGPVVYNNKKVFQRARPVDCDSLVFGSSVPLTTCGSFAVRCMRGVMDGEAGHFEMFGPARTRGVSCMERNAATKRHRNYSTDNLRRRKRLARIRTSRTCGGSVGPEAEAEADAEADAEAEADADAEAEATVLDGTLLTELSHLIADADFVVAQIREHVRRLKGLTLTRTPTLAPVATPPDSTTRPKRGQMMKLIALRRTEMAPSALPLPQCPKTSVELPCAPPQSAVDNTLPPTNDALLTNVPAQVATAPEVALVDSNTRVVCVDSAPLTGVAGPKGLAWVEGHMRLSSEKAKADAYASKKTAAARAAHEKAKALAAAKFADANEERTRRGGFIEMTKEQEEMEWYMPSCEMRRLCAQNACQRKDQLEWTPLPRPLKDGTTRLLLPKRGFYPCAPSREAPPDADATACLTETERQALTVRFEVEKESLSYMCTDGVTRKTKEAPRTDVSPSATVKAYPFWAFEDEAPSLEEKTQSPRRPMSRNNTGAFVSEQAAIIAEFERASFPCEWDGRSIWEYAIDPQTQLPVVDSVPAADDPLWFPTSTMPSRAWMSLHETEDYYEARRADTRRILQLRPLFDEAAARRVQQGLPRVCITTDEKGTLQWFPLDEPGIMHQDARQLQEFRLRLRVPVKPPTLKAYVKQLINHKNYEAVVLSLQKKPAERRSDADLQLQKFSAMVACRGFDIEHSEPPAHYNRHVTLEEWVTSSASSPPPKRTSPKEPCARASRRVLCGNADPVRLMKMKPPPRPKPRVARA